jgi:hypothetical protein
MVQPCRSLHRPATLKGAGQGDLVGVFELAAHRQAVGDATHRREGPQQARQVEAGGVALNAGGEGQDHFLHGHLALGGHPLHQRLNLEQLGADAVHRRDQAAQHVVGALELAGALHGQQVAGVGHHADLAGLALRVAADLTERLSGEVVTALALAHLAAGGQQGVGEGADLVLRLAQQVKGQALGRARADARQPLELLDQAGQGTGIAAQERFAIGGNVGPAASRMAPAPRLPRP